MEDLNKLLAWAFENLGAKQNLALVTQRLEAALNIPGLDQTSIGRLHYYLAMGYVNQSRIDLAQAQFLAAVNSLNNDKQLMYEVLMNFVQFCEQLELLQSAVQLLKTGLLHFPGDAWLSGKQNAILNRMFSMNEPEGLSNDPTRQQTKNFQTQSKGYFTGEVARQLFSAIEYLYFAEVEGDIAEFGTMSGESSFEIAQSMVLANDLGKQPRKLHLFDSFVGLPEFTSNVDQENQHVKSGIWNPGSCKVLNAEQLRARVAVHLPQENIVIHEGWYADSVPRLEAETRFGMLHVDCDLYQSTMDALSPLLERGQISEGAIILFDDWNCSRASPRLGERRAWAELTKLYEIEFSDEGAYSWGGHKFIIHTYQSKP